MERKTIFKIAAAGTSVALIIGGAGIATAHPSNEKGKKTFSRALSSLVGKGTITQNQADEITKAIDADRTAQEVAHTAAQTARESLVATTLGIDTATIKSRMATGETLAAIAGTKTDALIAALVKLETTEIDARVTAGVLTAAQATTKKATLQARVTAEINKTRGSMGGPGKGGPGRGGKGDHMGGDNRGGRGHGGGFGDRDGGTGPSANGGLTNNATTGVAVAPASLKA